MQDQDFDDFSKDIPEEEEVGEIEDPDKVEEKVVYETTVSTKSLQDFAGKVASGLETAGKSYMAAREYKERQRAIRRNARRARWSDIISFLSLFTRLF